jgi:cytidylate kinase
MEEFLRCRLAEEANQLRRSHSGNRPALTISRQAGTRGDAIGERLVDYLEQFDESAEHGWAFFDQSLVARVIEEHKMPDSLARYFREDSTNPVNEVIEQILGLHPSDWTLFHYTADTVRKLCVMGNVIVVGRGGNFITRDLPNTFHVRLLGSESHRVRTASRERNMSAAEARKFVRQTDKARAGYVKQNLNRQIDDPTGYHLVINTDLFSDELAGRIIGDTLLEWQATQALESPTAAA